MKTLIVGAGLSGLVTAFELSKSRDVVVFEKSRGVGGRLATRRTDAAKFDHGAQFYRLRDPLRDLHRRWLEHELVDLWFTRDGLEHWCAKGGMTALAKDLAADLEVILNERVTGLAREGHEWVVAFESGRRERAGEVVLSCPIPQTVELLKTSGIGYPAPLDRIVYEKALVVLIENSAHPFRFEAHEYLEPEASSLFSVADQRAKGISKVPALTVTLGADASAKHFDATDAEVTGLVREELARLSPGFEPGTMQVKRWRFSQIRESPGEPFARSQPGLYLVGDGFGGASLNGAARSAHALTEYLRTAES